MKFEFLQGHAVGIGEVRRSTNAEQDLMRILIFMMQVVSITSHDERKTGLLRNLLEFEVDFVLDIPMRR